MECGRMLKVLVPIGGVAVLLLLTAVIVTLRGGGGTAATTPATTDKAAEAANAARAAGDMVSAIQSLPDAPKFDFPLDGPEWKDIGEGLKIWDVKEGSGKVCPTLGERPTVVVTVQYTGWLTTGREFDGTRKPNKPPFESSLGQQLGSAGQIPGWQQGIPGMKVGGRRRLHIPSALGYGTVGREPYIPGGSALVFDVELLDVK